MIAQNFILQQKREILMEKRQTHTQQIRSVKRIRMESRLYTNT